MKNINVAMEDDPEPIYDMTQQIQAISEVGMDILCTEHIGQRVIEWIAIAHTLPILEEEWLDLIDTQFPRYYPMGKDLNLFTPLTGYNWRLTINGLVICARAKRIVKWLKDIKVLKEHQVGNSIDGLRADVHRCRSLSDYYTCYQLSRSAKF